MNGNVTNNAGQTVRISYNPATFTGTVVNNGTFKTTSTTATFAGTFTNNGTFASDPATNYFATLAVGPQGALTGGVGDHFYVSGDLVSASTQTSLWDTGKAALHFSGGTGTHTFTISGTDVGASTAGFATNFSWGLVSLAAGDTLSLSDGLTPGRALYVGALDLPGGTAEIASITGNGVNIYYDDTMSANAYLGDATYALAGGGSLAPAIANVPEPGSAFLFVAGTVLLAGVRRRRNGDIRHAA